MTKKPLSLDLRERVVAAVANGMSRRQAAEPFGVSALNLLSRFLQTTFSEQCFPAPPVALFQN
jgi:hypothetical protein